MNKLFLLIIAIFFGCVLSTGMMEAPKISNTDFDCTIKAIKHCGTDDTVCQDRIMKQCEKKTTVVEEKNYSHSYHKKHHTYKTSISIQKEIEYEDSDDENAQRICITDSNCNCKTVAKLAQEKCDPNCYESTLKECETRCRKSRRCYRMDCKNAGKTRCHRDVHLQCSLEHPDSHHKRSACIEEKSACCQRYEKATCQRAIRVYKFRSECTEESKAKCFGIADEKAKCTCVSQTRHTCLVSKVEKHRQTIREVFDCEESARMICSEKKCGPDYHFCLQKEKSICEPVCHKESRKECNNQVNGLCYEQSYKRCIHKWKKNYCEKRAEYKCGQDDECLSREKHHCKRRVPDCMIGLQSCDDKNKCTEDICHPTEGCINKHINCDDNNACTTESCDPALGCVYKTKKCDDGKLCTKDSCNPVTGQCKFVYDDKICHVCANGYCEKDLDCAAWEKSAKLSDSCQKAVCNAEYGSCQAVHVKGCANKCRLSCQPYHACDVATCVLNSSTNEYECVHSDKVCDDHKSCTIDTCDNKLGCQHKFNKGVCPPNPLCESDSECTAWETSNNLRNKCQKAICDKHKGICLAVSTSNECDEPICLASCRPRHSCETAKCQKNESGKYHCSRQPVICDDKKECTVDSCDQNLGCVFKYKADDNKCKPGLSCEHSADCKNYEVKEKLAERCLKAVCDVKLGACVTAPIDEKCDKELKDCQLNCQAIGQCQTAYCSKDEGNRYFCSRIGKTCDDGITCTVDTCDDKLGCVHTYKPNDVDCPVGGQCKRDSDCVTWGFTQNLGQQCKRPVCDIKAGACRAVAKIKKCITPPECQLTCKAQNACETATCVINTEGDYYCKRVSRLCNDNDDCTLDTCDATTGNCLYTPIQSDKCNKCTKQSDCEALNKKLSVDCKSAYCDTTTQSCKVVPSKDAKCLDKVECLRTCVAKSKCEVATCVYDETKKKHTCQRTRSTDSSCTKQNECELNCKAADLCETASCSQLPDGSFTCVRASNTCNDNKSCTKDSCDGTTGKCVNTYVVSDKCLPGANCEKNLDCAKWGSQQQLDVCLTPVCDIQSGSCKAIPNKYKCSTKTCNKECPPRNACEESTCAYDSTTKKLVCEYVRKSCDDKNRCTVDSCDVSKGCVNTFDKTIRGCDSPRCETPKDCIKYAQDNNLADDCKDAICDAETKTCRTVLIDNPKCNPSFNKCRRECKPRSACETAECIVDAQTKKFKCSLSSITCNDNNACTVDVCDPVKGCKYTYTISDKCEQYCTDNNDCTTYGIKKQASLSCQVPYCDKATTTCKLQDDPNKNCKKIDIKCELVCKPKDACHTARCVRKGDNELTCVQEPITCNDGQSCTEDSCDTKKGCQFTFKQSKICKKPCAVDIDCDNWAVTEKLADKCEKAKCSRKLGSCVAVKGPQTEKCKTTDQCKLTSECPQDGFGSVCCQENGVRQCCKNQCETDLDCVPKDKKKEWGYCRIRDSGKRECEFLPKCTGNDGCDDKNPCTKDVCITEYGFCKNIRRCVDNSECTLDICEAGKDGKSYTCKNPVKTCTNDKTLLDKNYDLLTPEQKTKWLGKCSHVEGCVSCVVNKQCDDNNGCTEDSCINQFCVSKPIDNKWCDPKLKGQAITVQGYFPKFTRL